MNFTIYLSFTWQTFTSILLFLLALSILVAIHELGHLIAAKVFKVYCEEYSIGFGPRLCRVRPKKSETFFKIGLLPLGGYVAMYGEGEEGDYNGLKLPKERSVIGIARWKRLIVFSGGILMNFILAYFIFLISVSCFKQYKYYSNVAEIILNDGRKDKVVFDNQYVFKIKGEEDKALGDNKLIFEEEFNQKIKDNDIHFSSFEPLGYDESSLIKKPLPDAEGEPIYLPILDLTNFNKNDYNYINYIKLIEVEDISTQKENEYTIYNRKRVKDGDNFKYAYQKVDNTTSFYIPKLDENNKPSIIDLPKEYSKGFTLNCYDAQNIEIDSESEGNLIVIEKPELKIKGGKANIEMFVESFYYGWNSFKEAGILWVDSTTAISKALGGLFIGKGYDQVGGPVAIFTQTTGILTNYPFYVYLQTWGIISVNLALFNLLPFPGLDGWQILVTIIEGSVNFVKRRIYIKKNKFSKNELKKLKKIEEKRVNEVVTASIKFNQEFLYNEALKKKRRTKNIKENNEPIIIENNENNPSSNQEVLNEETKIILEDKKKEVKKASKDYLGFSEWGIPNKVKNIVSYVGLVILFGFMGVVFLIDILRLLGVM